MPYAARRPSERTRRRPERWRRGWAVAIVGSLVAGLGPVLPAQAATGRPRPEPGTPPLLASPTPEKAEPLVPAGRSSVPRREPVPVRELMEERSASKEMWENADGSRSVREYAVPRYYQPGGSREWSPIDPSLVPVPGRPGWWRSAANRWEVSFGPAGAKGGNEQLVLGGKPVGFAPVGVADRGLVPSVAGSMATYTGLWPQVDAEYRVSAAGVDEALVLRGPGRQSRSASIWRG